MTSDVNLSTVLTETQRTETQQVQLAQDLDDFLTLLTTQLQNQDPLNPMDSTEFTNQIVQFSQVEQMINQNQKLNDILQLELAGISSIALGYVGLDASYIGSELSYDGTNPTTITYSLAGDATVATLTILDEGGNVVRTVQVPKSLGKHDFVWDGTDSGGFPVPAGTYSVNLGAADKDGNTVENTTVVSGRVRGIESQNGVVFLLVGERAVPISQIINATLPPESATTTTSS